MSKDLYKKFEAILENEAFQDLDEFEDWSTINDAFMYGEVETVQGEYTGEEGLKLIELLEEANLKIALEKSFGGEGQGDQFWAVWSVTDGTDTVYVMFSGWYASYVGAEFTERLQVYPKEVTKIEYFDKP